MSDQRSVNPHLQRQIVRLMRALESLPPGTSLHVTRETHGLRWQPINPPIAKARPIVVPPAVPKTSGE